MSRLLCSILYHPVLAVTVTPLTLNIPKPYENFVKPVSSDYDLLFKFNTDLVGRKGSPSEFIDQSSYFTR
jgi:hypothetical protein